MSNPLPSPRLTSGDLKKPVPTPRRTKMPENVCKSIDDNSFSRKAKQKLEDIGEGTRQSLRKLSRRFSSASQKERTSECKEDDNLEVESLEIFNSITFESPIVNNPDNNIYNNVHPDNNIYNNVNLQADSSASEWISLPPPSHPPPPLPEDSLYDAPSSVTSNSTSTSTNSSFTSHKKHDYETVFPSTNKKEFIVGTDDSADEPDNLSMSESWKYYDPVVRSNSDVDLRPSTSKPNDNASVSDTLHSNSLYENYKLPVPSRATKSVILQFDPLTNDSDASAVSSSKISEMNILEEMLQGDLYATTTVGTLETWSLSNDSDGEEYLNPPTPPTRVDSLPEEEFVPQSPTTKSRNSKSQWFDDETSNGNTNNNLVSKKNSFRKFLSGPLILKNIRANKENLVDRPEISASQLVQKKGRLFKVQNSTVDGLFGEYNSRWCILECGNFVCYSDVSCNSIKEHFKASSILSVQILQDSKYKYRHNNDALHCFELNVAGKIRGSHIYGSRDESDTRVWLQTIADSLTSKFPTIITSRYTRFGWAYIREALSGTWTGAWIVLKDRELSYATNKHNTPKNIDLRKARCIVLQQYQENDKNPSTNDRGPNMLIDCPGMVLYLRMWTARETKVWCHIIKLAAHNNGPGLEEQQLTKNNIPVIVETCINFIYLHGSMSEGIYRKQGTNSSIAEIISNFRSNAFSVHLKIDKYTEHDVATALKRFFRDLPKPLITSDKRQYLHEVSKINNKEEKIRMYKAILEELPEITYKVTRKLLGHLHFISSHKKKNLMNKENLASIWGPTLIHSEYKKESVTDKQQMDIEVVSQLIKLYRDIFPEDQSQIEKEKAILSVLEKYYKSPQLVFENKSAGDLRIWIYLMSREGTSVNISVGPNKTAFDIAVELSPKLRMNVDELVVKEVILEGKLHRPVHHTEKILDVVLRWGYWDEPDRKDNYLVLSRLSDYGDYMKDKLAEIQGGDLKFADSKSKFFKTYSFNFSAATLRCYKEVNSEIELYSWKIEDILWYIGHESKRNPGSRYTITFIEKKAKPNRTKTNPYFGNVLVWSDADSRAKWLHSMLKAQYPNNLKPPVRIVNL